MDSKKGSKSKIIISIGLIIGILALFYAVYSTLGRITAGTINPINEPNEDFAKCLSEKSVKMYGAYWCPHCQNNKEMFGNGGKILVDLGIYVECEAGGENPQADVCSEKGISGYPTWEISNNLYSGEMSLDKIAELSGCNLE